MKKSTSFEVRLVRTKALAPAVRELVFERVDGEIVDFDPGQWLNLSLPLPSGPLVRAYSIASAPNGSGRFELAVTRVENGPASTFLHAIQEGAVLTAIGPLGMFTRDGNDPSPALFVGTGTGVSPLRSMLHAALAQSSRAPLWLLFGARHEADVLYREEMEALASAHSNVRYFVSLSRPGDAWKGRSGYVQTHVPTLLAELSRVSGEQKPHVFVCGLERMVKTVRELCRSELGVDRKHVHTERYD